MNVKEKTLELYEDMVFWRRDFHAHPELGFQETRTSGKIVEALEKMEVEIVKDFFSTAVIAIIVGEKKGPIVGFRADIDALPLQDMKDVSYKSTNAGVCHACGHDSHTAIGLGLAKYLSENKESLKGTVKIVFQPAEEGPAPGGAKPIVETGIINDIEYMLGIHVNPEDTVGTIAVKEKVFQAGAYNIKLTIKGTGGHGGYPFQTIDPLATGVEIYNSLQHIITREVNGIKGVVLSICSFNAGVMAGTNVIPSEATMSGTIRFFDEEVGALVERRVREKTEKICQMNNCKFELEIVPMCIPVINDVGMVASAIKVSEGVYGSENIKYIEYPEAGYDDFAFYGKISRACMVSIGSSKLEDVGKAYLHQPYFDIDESFMPRCVEFLVKWIGSL